MRWLGLKEPAEEATGALANEQLGSIAVRLALYPQEWIERRVEGVQFMDDTTVRQRVSVTLRHPQPGFFSDAARPNEGQLIYVPLALLSKRTLRKLDVAYEDGATFAVPATARNGELTSLGLSEAVWGYSETRGRAGLSARSLEVLDLLVRAPRDKAEPLLDMIKDADEELGQVLMEPNEFRGLTFDLAENFMLLAPVTYEAGVERVVKYSYSLPLPWKLSVRNLTAYLGLTDFAQQLTDLPIGFGASYDNIAAEHRLVETRRMTARSVPVLVFRDKTESNHLKTLPPEWSEESLYACIRGALSRCVIKDHAWRRGDILVVDNHVTLHARSPFSGTRRLVRLRINHSESAGCRGEDRQ